MESIYRSLKAEAAEAGTNLTEACKRAGVNRTLLTRWKHSQPKTLVIIEKLRIAIRELREESEANPNA